MADDFPSILSRLRREKHVNQRTAAAALNISQALLSHYENGLREPGLDFIGSACDYYSVSADYLLGRSSIKIPYTKKRGYPGYLYVRFF
jgi:Helix-turn-helix.